MILYDTFSVNIPVKNPKESKIEPGVTSRRSKEFILNCQNEEASSSLDHNDHVGVPTVNLSLTNDGAKCRVIDVAAVTHGHDDAKENLDPVSRRCNGVLSNISLTNTSGDTAMNEYGVCGESDGQMRLVSSDTNLSALTRTICNTNVDTSSSSSSSSSGSGSSSNSIKDSAGLIPNDRSNRSSRANPGDTRHRRSVRSAVSAFAEERIGDRLFYAVHGVDFDLNVVNTNKNVEKVSQGDHTVSTSRRAADGRSDCDHMDDPPMFCLNDLLCATANNYNYNDCRHLDGTNDVMTTARERSVACAANIRFNECSITNRQIDARDFRQYVRRCRTFHENIVNTKNKDGYNDDPCFKVSIDLCKVQNLIDSKPELFVTNPNDADNQREHKCVNQLRDKGAVSGGYTQRQVKHRDSDSIRYSPSRNSALPVSNASNIESVQARDLFARSPSMNTIERHRKLKRGARYFDKHILNR